MDSYTRGVRDKIVYQSSLPKKYSDNCTGLPSAAR
jgi:hypothetical protein